VGFEFEPTGRACQGGIFEAYRGGVAAKPIKAPRMEEIAVRLKISAATVSRALRNDPRISEPVRQRVRETAAAMGYRPNPLVSALMASRRRRGGNGEVDTIALVIDGNLASMGGRRRWTWWWSG